MTIALPKGRLFDKCNELFTAAGHRFSVGERRLVAKDQTGELEAILVKNSDLPTYVHHGIAGLGICGSDVIYESGYEFFELLPMPFGTTRICLAGKADTPEADRSYRAGNGRLRVATKFTRFTRDFFHNQGIPVDIVQLNGSVELAPVLGLTPYIVDLVETGSTLKAHNLEVKEVLGSTRVSLFANPAFYKYHYDVIDELVKRLRAVLE